MRIFVAGPYQASTKERRDLNIRRAEEAGKQILLRGHFPYVPHTATARWDDDPRLNLVDWLTYSCEWLKFCDGVLLLKKSPGTNFEVSLALLMGLPVWTSLEQIPNGRRTNNETGC